MVKNWVSANFLFYIRFFSSFFVGNLSQLLIIWAKIQEVADSKSPLKIRVTKIVVLKQVALVHVLIFMLSQNIKYHWSILAI